MKDKHFRIPEDQAKDLEVIAGIAPKTLFPIHTEHPELYARFVSWVTRVQVPEKNKTARVV